MSTATKKANVKDKSAYVETYDGNKALRRNTRYINGDYYVPNVSCFRINNRWYRINSQYIALDSRTGAYALKDNLKEGVISITKTGKLKMGFFSWDEHLNALIKIKDPETNQIWTTWSEDIITSKFQYSYIDDAYVLLDRKQSKKTVNYWFQSGKLNNYFWDDGPVSKDIERYYKTFKPKIRPEYVHLEKILGNFTFGLEFETTKGTIPSWKLFELGLIPVRDGSISGFEYTTVPLQGAKGLQTIENICNALAEHCLMDYSCSLHIHVGNVRNDKLYLLAVYAAAVKVQQEMFSIVPLFKRNQKESLGSQKDYCKALPPLAIGTFTSKDMDKQKEFIAKVENDFKVLFKFLSGGFDLNKDYNRNNHPQGNQKWNQLARYHWLNLMNMVFGKNQTIEFRIHHGTFNPTKVLNWLFICIGFLKFVDGNTTEIFNPKFAVVLNDFADVYSQGSRAKARLELSKLLKEYLAKTKARFREYELAHEAVPKSELTNDLKQIKESVLTLSDFFEERLGHFDVTTDCVAEEESQRWKIKQESSPRTIVNAPWEKAPLQERTVKSGKVKLNKTVGYQEPESNTGTEPLCYIKLGAFPATPGMLYTKPQELAGNIFAIQAYSSKTPEKEVSLFNLNNVFMKGSEMWYISGQGPRQVACVDLDTYTTLRNIIEESKSAVLAVLSDSEVKDVKSEPSKGASFGTKHYPISEEASTEKSSTNDIW